MWFRNSSRWLGLLVVLAAALAAGCGAAASQAPVANETPVGIAGPQVKYDKVQLTLPSGLATGVTARIAPQGDAGPGAPFWAVFPDHTELVFAGYPVAGSLHEARIEVYSVAKSRQMNPTVATAITDLQAALSKAPTLPSGKIPALPLVDGAQVFQAQVKFLDFKTGQGIRFITQYDQGPLPINNHEIFYTYQGLTKDGQYYVAAVLPVNAAFLAPDEKPNSAVPAEGVVMPDLTSGDLGTAFAGYLQQVTGKLNSAAAGQFTPGLDALDSLMQSIEVK